MMKSMSGKSIMAFRSIPYAKAPVGELRFKDPVPAESWNGVLDATLEAPVCPQFDYFSRSIKGTEDCLMLNVYTHSVGNDGTSLRPVMFWIHGGGFVMGDGNGETGFYGPDVFLDRDVILVTINYRLGPFGFLTTADGEAPGNYGLLDQTLALQWVRDNIRQFGGDPQSVTIFGESAGGASVHFHMLSPHSKGLFHRAIAQSGTGLSPWALWVDTEKRTTAMAEKFNCSTASSKQIIECLKTRSALEIILLTVPNEVLQTEFVFGPRVDVERKNAFLPEHPRTLMATGRINSVPFITGVNQNEGALLPSLLMADGGKVLRIFEKDPVDFFVKSGTVETLHGFKEMPKADQVRFAKSIFDHYQYDANRTLQERMTLLEQIMSDSMFFKSTEDTVDLHAKHSSEPIFYYFYNHRGQVSLSNFLGAPSTFDLGVSHFDECFLMFNITKTAMNEQDQKVSKILIDLWTSFASHGKSSSTQLRGSDWLPVKSGEPVRYLIINTAPVMTSEPIVNRNRLQFWDVLGGSASSSNSRC